jgi:hypothetical protein
VCWSSFADHDEPDVGRVIDLCHSQELGPFKSITYSLAWCFFGGRQTTKNQEREVKFGKYSLRFSLDVDRHEEEVTEHWTCYVRRGGCSFLLVLTKD